MKSLSNIDPWQSGRPPSQSKQRRALGRIRRERDHVAGYEQLTELCRLGEVERAKQLAYQHSAWGYQIVDGMVIEHDVDLKS